MTNICFLFTLFVILHHPNKCYSEKNRVEYWGKSCRLSAWSEWGKCSSTCGNDRVKRKHRFIIQKGSKDCDDEILLQVQKCPSKCCPIDCKLLYTPWGQCFGCGEQGRQSRYFYINQYSRCGGKRCPSNKIEYRNCTANRCCPVNCQVSSWGSWGSCNAACDSVGHERRSRNVTTANSCGGKLCPFLQKDRVCNGKCCPKDCRFSAWTQWSVCKSPKGLCQANSGQQKRSRSITIKESCGGTCGSTEEVKTCTPSSTKCQLSNWAAFTSCQPNNGKCGPGKQTRSRKVVVNPVCSPKCDSLIHSRVCFHSCCPEDCVYSDWGTWSVCSVDCGDGFQWRNRTILKQGTCKGKICDQTFLQEKKKCSASKKTDCELSPWSIWGACGTNCGGSLQTRTRNITQQPGCYGAKCGKLIDKKLCYDYSAKQNCQVSEWSNWTPCQSRCDLSTKKRIRMVLKQMKCGGQKCPNLEDIGWCGKKNGGCDQICSDGVCSCRSGFNLVGNSTCQKKDCGVLFLSNCPTGLSSKLCSNPLVVCPDDGSKYPVKCDLSCPVGYKVIGPTTVSCQSTGAWSPSQSYCKLINEPPSDIILSNNDVQENAYIDTTIGILSTKDANVNDTHWYKIISDSCVGCISLDGNKLKTSISFDFERMKTVYQIKIQSTDNGIVPLSFDKMFTITIDDINESPTDISISNNVIDENSDIGTVIGELQTTDEDINQTFIYEIKSSQSLFKIKDNKVLVASSNQLCLSLNDPSICPLNFEKSKNHTLIITSVDTGYPPLSFTKKLDIKLRDVNDVPYDIQLTKSTVKENAPAGTLVGNVTVKDEDANQRFSFKILNNASNEFHFSPNGSLYKTKASDYEILKQHVVEVEVSDNGIPIKKSSKWFTISILDVNEPPINVTLTPASNTFKGPNGSIILPENTLYGTYFANITILDEDVISNLSIMLINYQVRVKEKIVQCQFSPQLKKSVCQLRMYLIDKISYERQQKLSIVTRITDRGLVFYKMLSVFVTDSNDAPSEIFINNGNVVYLLENVRGANIGFLTTKDEDLHQNHTYKYFFPDPSIFMISDNLISLKPASYFNHERIAKFVLNIQSTDNGNPPMSVNDTIIIRVIDTNDPPSNVSLSNTTVKENLKVGTFFSSITINDEDLLSPNSQTHPCKIINTSYFTVVDHKIKLQQELDFESEPFINITIQVKDQSILTYWHFTITVTDVNEKPTSISLSNVKLNENMVTPSLIGNLSAIDPDNGNQFFKFEIMTNRQLFTVKNNQLFALKMFNYESMATIDVSIKVTDSGNLHLTELKVITILDQNDVISDIELSNNVINENSPSGTLVGFVTPKDEDSSQGYKCHLITSNNGRFELQGNELTTALNNSICLRNGGQYCQLNYEEAFVYDIQITCEDNGYPVLSSTKDFKIYLNDVNDRPYNLSVSGYSLKENAPIGEPIGLLSANDEDSSDTLTFSILSGGKYFYIDGKNNLCKKSNFSDFEKNAFHKVTVQVSDNGDPMLKIEHEFIIDIINENEAPVDISILPDKGQTMFLKNKPSINENSDIGTIIGTIESNDQDKSSKLSITLDDDASGLFKISNATNCVPVNKDKFKTKCQTTLTTNHVFNFEEKSSYKIIVRSTDQHGLYRVQQFMVAIIDKNDPPNFIRLSGKNQVSIMENQHGIHVADLTTSDEDYNQSFNYKLLSNEKIFLIKQNQLFLQDQIRFDYEVTKSVSVNIQSTDNGSPTKSISKIFNLSIENVNEPPVRITIANKTVTENIDIYTTISDIHVFDPDNTGGVTAQTHTCNVIGRYSYLFKVNNTNSNVLQLLDSLDFEKASSYRIKIKCTDSGSPSLSLTNEEVITVLDVNERPNNIMISSNYIPENSFPKIIGTLNARDPDRNQVLTFSLVNMSVPFEIKNQNLLSTKQLDYEEKKQYQLQIKVTDNGQPNLSFTSTLSVHIEDENEAPTDITLTNNTVNENSGTGTIIGSFSGIDADRTASGDTQSFTYILTHNPFGIFRLFINQLQVAVDNTTCITYGGIHCKLNLEAKAFIGIKVKIIDDGTPVKLFEKDFKIRIVNQNDAPRNLKLSSNILPENATKGYVIGLFTVQDEDSWQYHTFSLVANDENRFSINRNNELVKEKDTNYESKTVHRIFVEVTDNGSPFMKISKEFDIYVQDINESPTNLSITDKQSDRKFPINKPVISENLPIYTVIGTIEAIDEDTVQDLKFTLLDNPDYKFKLDTKVQCLNKTVNNGKHTQCQVLLLSNSTFNYEEDDLFKITVKVADHAGLTRIQSFDILIADENDAPFNITIQGEVLSFVNENEKYRLIGALETEDEDNHLDFSYELLNDADGKFSIHTDLYNTYRLYTTGMLIDYEVQSSYVVTVKTTDSGLPPKSYTANLTIQVLDVNEKPTAIIIDTPSVNENSKIGTVVSRLSVVDPDVDQDHDCTVVSSNDFKMNDLTPQSLVTLQEINYETDNSITVSIQCIDSGYPEKRLIKDLVIFVNDTNDAPTGISITGATVPENQSGYTIGMFIVADEDTRDNHTYAITQGKEYFEVVNGNELTNLKMFNYENQSVFNIEVQVKDKQGLAYQESFSVSVEDRNDAPADIVCSGTMALSENAPPGSSFGNCVAVDEEDYQSHQYKILYVLPVGFTDKQIMLKPSDIFSIDAVTGKLELTNAKLDYETFYQYVITIQATDNGSPILSVKQNKTVYIMNENQPPTDISLSYDKVIENSKLGTVVGNLTVYDPDNKNKKVQSHSCWINNVDGSLCPFTVNINDQVTVQHPKLLDYEKHSYYKVSVRCVEDNDIGFSIKKTFDIVVVNVNEAPYNITLQPSNTIDEHNDVNQFIALVNYIDPDNKNIRVNNITKASLRTFGGPFKLSFPYLYSTVVLDYETKPNHTIEITLHDDGIPQMSYTQNITIQINNLNDVPIDIILSQYEVAEDAKLGSVIASIGTADKDIGQTHSYVLIDDAGFFEVSNDQLLLKSKLDYEMSPTLDILVEATDSGIPAMSFRKVIKIMVLDANDAPSAIESTSISVPENTRSRYKIVDLKVIDEDVKQSHSCRCVSSNKDWFEFQNEKNGNVSIFLFSNRSSFDYEFIENIKLQIRCFDDGTPSLYIDNYIKVKVLDVNEAPTEILLGNSKTVLLNENPINQQLVGALSCVDSDVNQAHVYQLQAQSKDMFQIVRNNQLLVKHLNNFDYESPLFDSVKVDIQVTDNGSPNLSYKDTITLIATDVNEPPMNISLLHDIGVLSENSSPGIYVGELSSENPEKHLQVVTYELLNYVSMFTLVSTHAPAVNYFLSLTKELDYDVQPFFEISIKATDNGRPNLSTVGSIFLNISKGDPCSLNQLNCSSNAVCERVNKTISQCVCLPGYEHNREVCQPINECAPKCEYCIDSSLAKCNKSKLCSPCQNNGKCVDMHLNYTCSCTPGYAGHDCSIDIDDCLLTPCKHDSTCVDGINNFTCICRKGYKGNTCSVEINECDGQPCSRGKCVDLINGYKCNCPTGFTGLKCQRKGDVCDDNTCKDAELCHSNIVTTDQGSHTCVPFESVLTINFIVKFATDSNLTSWKTQLHYFLLRTVSIPLVWLKMNTEDVFQMVYMSDAGITDHDNFLLTKLPQELVSNADTPGFYNEQDSTKFSFYGLYKDKVVPKNVLLYSINETCEELFNDCSLITHQFECGICAGVNKYISSNNFIKKPSYGKSQTDDAENSKFSYILVGAIACGALLIIIITIFIVRRRRNQYSFKRKSNETDMNVYSQHSATEPEDDIYMGKINPIFGFDENEVQHSELFENATPEEIFADSPSQKRNRFKNINNQTNGNAANNTGIENPLYGEIIDT